LEVNPEFIFICQWNEWIAGRFIYRPDRTGPSAYQYFMGRRLKPGETIFVDEFNQEYSRDIEPMKAGHTDNYYYQMVGNIRRFKGVRPAERPSAPKTINIDGNFDDWQDVKPRYRDHIYDTFHRINQPGWGGAGPYNNTTGRNDFVALKVAHDDRYVYFYARTREKLTSYKDKNWMLLFIDSDYLRFGNRINGWEGYDYLVNYEVIDERTTTLKRTQDGWNWKTVREIPCVVRGNQMELSIPRADLGVHQTGPNVVFDFHWADNIRKDDDIIEFARGGDSAPDRRFNYSYNTFRRNHPGVGDKPPAGPQRW